MSKIVATEEITALAEKIKKAISANPPKYRLSLGILLSQILTPQDMSLMDHMENQYGYYECNKWLVEIMASTGSCEKLLEDGYVSARMMN